MLTNICGLVHTGKLSSSSYCRISPNKNCIRNYFKIAILKEVITYNFQSYSQSATKLVISFRWLNSKFIFQSLSTTQIMNLWNISFPQKHQSILGNVLHVTTKTQETQSQKTQCHHSPANKQRFFELTVFGQSFVLVALKSTGCNVCKGVC